MQRWQNRTLLFQLLHLLKISKFCLIFLGSFVSGPWHFLPTLRPWMRVMSCRWKASNWLTLTWPKMMATRSWTPWCTSTMKDWWANFEPWAFFDGGILHCFVFKFDFISLISVWFHLISFDFILVHSFASRTSCGSSHSRSELLHGSIAAPGTTLGKLGLHCLGEWSAFSLGWCFFVCIKSFLDSLSFQRVLRST